MAMPVKAIPNKKIIGENAAKIADSSEAKNTRRHDNFSISNQPLAVITNKGKRIRITTVASLPEFIAEIATGEIAYNNEEDTVSQRLSDNRFRSICKVVAIARGAKKNSAAMKNFTLPKNGIAEIAITASQGGAAALVPRAIECHPLK